MESHSRELQLHCYRMLGSFADAEDAVQETMLASWQGIGGFTEERASLRTGLYTIVTKRDLASLPRATPVRGHEGPLDYRIVAGLRRRTALIRH